MARTLGQVVALEAAARSEANKRLGKLHKDSQKEQLFTGFSRTYAPFEESDDNRHQLPAEVQHVQLSAGRVLEEFMSELAPAVDLALTRDVANASARANVTVDGEIVFADVPATWLLHMSKVLDDVATFIAKLPVLSPAEEWQSEEGTLWMRTPETFTVRTEKRAVPLVLSLPTKEHPAQVQVVTEDVPTGRWTTVKRSGALTAEHKREMERRIAALQGAVKTAREQANREDAPGMNAGVALARYLLD
jgi:hypothetical protein